MMNDTVWVINDKLGKQDNEENLQKNQDWNMPDFAPFAHVLEAQMQRHDGASSVCSGVGFSPSDPRRPTVLK